METQIGVRLDEHFGGLIETIANDRGCTKTEVIRSIIAEHFERKPATTVDQTELLNTINGLSNQLNTISKYVVALSGKIANIESKLQTVAEDARSAKFSSLFTEISEYHNNTTSPYRDQIEAVYEEYRQKNGYYLTTGGTTNGSK